MKHLSILAGLLLLAAAVDVRGQLAYYIDENGRRVYINAAPPRPASKLSRARNAHRYSVLVKRDPFTNRLVVVPPPPDPVEKAADQKGEAAQAAPAPHFPALTASSTPPAGPSTFPEAAAASYLHPRLRLPWPSFDSLIQKSAERHAVDANLVRAIIQVESNFNPFAVSYKGAMGLMQLVPGTAHRFGVGNVFDPMENVDGGVRYLKYLLGLYGGDLKLSLAAYNAGEKAVERHGGVPPYPETLQYVQRIATLYGSSNRAERNRWGIVKYVDENGRTHFTNTDIP